MSVRNILVAFNGSESALSALKYAAALAGDTAHVTAILAYSTHETVDSQAAWVPARARQIIAQANEEILTQIETRFDAARDLLGLAGRLHFKRAPGRVDTVLAETARCYDLLVAGQAVSEPIDAHVALHPDRIALLSGRPVLIVPEDHDAERGRGHAIVAWDGGRAAARALSDSLGLLEKNGRVTVLTVGEAAAGNSAAELVRHLERHHVEAAHRHIAADPGVARALLAYCEAQSPSLLVMGAYEHSKFREDFLGGVTARVLRRAPVPVLLSH